MIFDVQPENEIFCGSLYECISSIDSQKNFTQDLRKLLYLKNKTVIHGSAQPPERNRSYYLIQ